ncbi:hypothetical protein DFJ74DRAFT_744819 [Hyaloraphidium curvatum]|nr:hypothetical protein DFJ74DRAFT_744819 [Hyaloraphidium curvatum]
MALSFLRSALAKGGAPAPPPRDSRENNRRDSDAELAAEALRADAFFHDCDVIGDGASAGRAWPPAAEEAAEIDADSAAQPGAPWSFPPRLGVATTSFSYGYLPAHALAFPGPDRTVAPPLLFRTAVADLPLYFPFPGERRIGYFEASVRQCKPGTALSVGLVAPPYPPFRPPGWHANSVAFADDGRLHFGSEIGKRWCAPWPQHGPVVGCGVLYAEGGGAALGVFFTRDGRLINRSGYGATQGVEDALVDLPVELRFVLGKQLHAAVGAEGPAVIAVNFGELPFMWERANEHAGSGGGESLGSWGGTEEPEEEPPGYGT